MVGPARDPDSRAIYIAALAVVASMLVIAGTSRLGGFSIGVVVFVWGLSEMGRLDLAVGTRRQDPRLAGPARCGGRGGASIVAAIGFDGFGWKEWGGIHVNLFTAVVGITLGMPFGILLALGRQSKLPVVRTASVLYIEFVRGVPLISLLLFSKLLLPLFLPTRLGATDGTHAGDRGDHGVQRRRTSPRSCGVASRPFTTARPRPPRRSASRRARCSG